MFVLLIVYPGRLMNQNDVLCVLYSYVENRIGGVMVSVLASSAVDRGFEPRSGQIKDY